MTSNDDQPGRRNPWGRPPSDNGPWGQTPPPSKNTPEGPDFDEILRRARIAIQGDGRGIAFFAVLVIALWLASGVFRVQTDENAVIKRFGDYTRTQVHAGLGYHMPWPIETVTKLNVTLDRRVQIGFSDATLNNNNDRQRRDVADESLMLTADANIVDIDVVVLWNIAEAEQYMFNIRNPEQTIKRVAESAIREAVGQTRLQQIITEGRDDVAVRIQAIMQGMLDSYGSGVAIKQVLIQEATVHPEVLEAYNDVAASRQDAERFQNEATIYRNDIIPKARGEAIKMRQDAEAYKQDVIARAQGDAKRFTETLESYRTGKDVTRDRIYIETMEKVLGNANRLIIDQKVGGSGAVPYLPLDMIRRNTPPTAPAQTGMAQ